MLSRLSFLLIPLLGLILIAQAVPLFVSATNSLKVTLFLEDWQARDKISNPTSWDIAHEAAIKSLAWAPVANGQLYTQLGELYLWRAYRLETDNPEPAWRSAMEAFAHDHQLRPSWPYPLLELTSLKMRLSELDEDYQTWQDAFHITAQWRGDLLTEWVIESLYHWPILDHHQRRHVLETSVHAINMDRRVARKLRQELENTQLKALFCLYFTLHPIDTSQVCR